MIANASRLQLGSRSTLPARIPFVASRLPVRAPVVVKASSVEDETVKSNPSQALLAITSVVAPLLLDNNAALAINREYGIIEGQIFSLIHPAIMFFLFGSSVYAGYLGFQWRHTRELADEIKALKAQRAPAAVGPDGQALERPPSPVDSQISELEKVKRCFSLLLFGSLSLSTTSNNPPHRHHLF